MHSEALVKVEDLPLEHWDNPEWIPSEKTNKAGVNIGVVAWKQRFYNLRPKQVKKKPSTSIFSALCGNRKNCSLVSTEGRASQGVCEIINGQFQKWIEEPNDCGCIKYNRSMKYGVGAGSIMKKIHKAEDAMAYGKRSVLFHP